MAQEVWNASLVDGQQESEATIDPTNYAGNTKTETRFRDEISSQFHLIRGQRNIINKRWDRYFRIWEGTHVIKYYEGEADLRIRMGRKITDTFVSQIKTQIWPENQLYKIFSQSEDAQEMIPQIQGLLNHDVEQAQLKRKTELFLTTGFIYGISIYKTYWKTRESTNYRRRRLGNSTVVQPEKVILYEGPATEVIDPLRWYIHPITARTLDDAQIVFEDMDTTMTFLKDMQQKGIYKNIKDIVDVEKNIKVIEDVDSERDLRTQDAGFTVSNDIRQAIPTLRLTEIYAQFDLYGDGRQLPVKATMVGETIVELRQNPFFDQKPPYNVWRVTDLIDNFYGQGLIALIEDYQYAIDALINQGIDSANFQINHIIMYDESRVDRDKLKVRPRALWPVDGPVNTAINIDRPPNTSAEAFATAAQIIGLMQDVAGAPPVIQGKTGDRAQTATEASLLQQGATTFTNAMASKLESDVLSPLLRKYYFLEQQFRDPERTERIVGPMPKVSQTDLVGDYDFTWFVSTQAAQALAVQQINGGITAGPANGGQAAGGEGGEGGLGALLNNFVGQGED